MFSIALSSTCIQNFSNQHSAFFFFFITLYSVAVAAWSGIHVEPHIIYFEPFYRLVRVSHFSTSTPPNNIFLVLAAEKIYFKHSSKKRQSSQSLSRVTLLFFFTNLRRADRVWQTKQRFCCHLWGL